MLQCIGETTSMNPTISEILERARHYVTKIPGAVSGTGGHSQTFAVACALVRPLTSTNSTRRVSRRASTSPRPGTRQAYGQWLDPEVSDTGALAKLLAPYAGASS
jgi:hypothetical protein